MRDWNKGLTDEIIENEKKGEMDLSPEEMALVAFAIKRKSKRRTVFGILWILGGLIFTLISFASAEPGGEFYIFPGAMIFGLILLIKGLTGISKSNKIFAGLSLLNITNLSEGYQTSTANLSPTENEIKNEFNKKEKG